MDILKTSSSSSSRTTENTSASSASFSFGGDNGYNFVQNVGEETLFETPERSGGEMPLQCHQTTYDQLSRAFPDAD